MKCVRNYVGIDISKLSFDVAISKESGYSYFKFPNTSDGFRALLDKISDPDVQVVMEASGPYYLMLATFLFEQGVDLSVVNPLVIRRFCQMRLSRTKTDKKDSKMIAEYGKAEQPAIWRPEPSYVLKLRQMQASIDQLVKSKTAILNQLQAFDQNTAKCKEVIKSMNKVLQCIEKQIVTLEQSMQLLIEQFHGDLFKRLQTIPGLGKKTALLLIVLSDGFTKFSNARQLCSYFGLSPRIFESGTSVKGKARITKMGMGKMRAMLYLCSWSAKKYNHACKDLYDRLVAKGKPKILALIAVANKLIKQAFSIAINNTQYNEHY